jgi:putative ATP-dependent endonuclease of OLD family
VDFEPYIRLLLTPLSDVRLADRVVVITDGDSGNLKEGQAPPGKRRQENLDTIAIELNAAEIFYAVINTYSLETELVRAGNDTLLKRVYLELHPRSEANWNSAVAQHDDAQALAVQRLFKSTRKGDFAQLLAERIHAGEPFTTPAYIAQAIEALVQ